MTYNSPEQKAAEVLLPLGCIHQNDTLMPYSFFDKEGREFSAKADFYHPGLELHIEIKDSHLNGKTSKANAEKAYSRVDPDRLRKVGIPVYRDQRFRSIVTGHSGPS
jgi:glutathionyl-hydroquinone reductase